MNSETEAAIETLRLLSQRLDQRIQEDVAPVHSDIEDGTVVLRIGNKLYIGQIMSYQKSYGNTIPTAYFTSGWERITLDLNVIEEYHGVGDGYYDEAF